ncbi:YciI family protein [Paractinoplanes brasiliensis]|uniref:YCII-related domain-containing protein n=1 Tax=Paractinoplanes brasiliensis TaxID=52695 RepID=A0A4R6J8N5_9ACTN|nr:YciI family protein [Actinoplanes brasiliensis]TDO31960.1 hypothetical protein C8E87_7399 [Actinoplanes brasiliensis]
MPKYILIVDHRPGAVDTPMEQWEPDDVKAHMDYYAALRRQLLDSGELVDEQALTGPEHAREVTSDGGPPVVTEGVFPESKEFLAGFQIVEVADEQRAFEIAAKVSAVPGPGGVPLRQPIGVRRVMDADDFRQLHPEL